MLIAMIILVWMVLGYSGWYVQIKRIGKSASGYDMMMIGPMMLIGPIGLWLALRRS